MTPEAELKDPFVLEFLGLVLAAEYMTTLPDERVLAKELTQARAEIERRAAEQRVR